MESFYFSKKTFSQITYYNVYYTNNSISLFVGSFYLNNEDLLCHNHGDITLNQNFERLIYAKNATQILFKKFWGITVNISLDLGHITFDENWLLKVQFKHVSFNKNNSIILK